MTTGYIFLFSGGHAPDGSGTGNNSAALSYVISTGAQTTNTPKASFLELLFDAATDEHWMFSFIAPGDYSSGGTLRGKIKSATVSAGNAIMKGGISPAAANSRNDDVFNAADLSAAIALPATAEQEIEFTITLTVTNVAANTEVVVFIGRDADNASDTATGDIKLTTLNFEYTTT